MNRPRSPLENALDRFSFAPLFAAHRIGRPISLARRWPRRLADRRQVERGPVAARVFSPDALIRVFAARTVRWRSIFAVHTWIVVKEKEATSYNRYDYMAWGEPIRTDGFAPDGRWFGAIPETVVAVDGERAAALIPRIRYVIENYRFRSFGDYSAWPGPNSNTFVRAAMDSVPELRAVLPPTAIGKDFPYDGRWIGITSSGIGVYVTLAGYLGLTVGWVEGFELNFLGAVIGFDLRRPAIKLPGLGRFGLAAGL